MYVDKMGFEHTGREGFLSRMRQVWEQFELEEQERDAEWEHYLQGHGGVDCFEHRRGDPRLAELVGKGIPDKYRKHAWEILIGYSGRAMPGYYADLLARSSPDSRFSLDIAQDLERTFPNHPGLQHSEGRDQLRRVLTAFAVRNPNIGYCQSMNFVSFFLLLVFQEEEKAFWALVVFVEELFPEYYSKHMIGSQVDLRCFNELLEQYLPGLHSHMKKLGVVIGVACTSWFLCLFCTTLCAPGVCVVWDNILFRGSHIIMEVGLAVMQQLGDKILMAKNLGDLTKVFGVEALLLDPLPLLLCAHAFAHLRPQVQASRMKHWTRITQEIDDLHERRDIRVLRERTGMDGAKLKDLRAEFKALSMDGSGITFLQFQQVLSRVLPHWASSNNTPLERIFEVFDEDADKILSFQELMSGLSILYQGSFDDKLSLIFKSFAVENKELLSRREALAMCDHVYNTFYTPFRKQPASPRSSPETIKKISDGDEYDDEGILKHLYAIVDKEFSEPNNVAGLSMDGLRQIVFTNPIVLKCFQPFGSSTMNSMYFSGSPSISPSIGANSLHILETPPTSPCVPSTSPPRSQGTLTTFAAFLQRSPQILLPSPLSPSSSSVPTSPSRTARLSPPLSPPTSPIPKSPTKSRSMSSIPTVTSMARGENGNNRYTNTSTSTSNNNSTSKPGKTVLAPMSPPRSCVPSSASPLSFNSSDVTDSQNYASCIIL